MHAQLVRNLLHAHSLQMRRPGPEKGFLFPDNGPGQLENGLLPHVQRAHQFLALPERLAEVLAQIPVSGPFRHHLHVLFIHGQFRKVFRSQRHFQFTGGRLLHDHIRQNMRIAARRIGAAGIGSQAPDNLQSRRHFLRFRTQQESGLSILVRRQLPPAPFDQTERQRPL